MARKRRAYHDGENVINFGNSAFVKDFRAAEVSKFPPQQQLRTPLDEVLWLLWVVRDQFDHQAHIYALEIEELAEIRGIALNAVQIERALARAGKRVLRKKFDFDEEVPQKTAYKIAVKGVVDLQRRYALAGTKLLFVDGTKPWTDRHLTLPQIASELKGRICVVDKYCGSGSLAILRHLRHGAPLQFLTGKINQNVNAFNHELKDFQKEVKSIQVRLFPEHGELHDRYIISDNAVVIVGHGIKDIGNKESFLVLLKGDTTTDLRKTLLQKFDDRWARSKPIS